MPSNALHESDPRWVVEEEAPRLATTAAATNSGRSLTLTIHASDDQASRTKLDVMKQLASIVNLVVEERSEQKYRALVEALTPDIQFSQNQIIEARMLGQARAAILSSNRFVPAAEIAALARFSSKNPSSQPNRWKRARQIFAIEYKGIDLYPLYALDQANGMRPLPVIADILRIFDSKDGWQIAFWFGSLNSFLNDKMPQDLLLSEPGKVLKAAELQAIGLQHG